MYLQDAIKKAKPSSVNEGHTHYLVCRLTRPIDGKIIDDVIKKLNTSRERTVYRLYDDRMMRLSSEIEDFFWIGINPDYLEDINREQEEISGCDSDFLEELKCRLRKKGIITEFVYYLQCFSDGYNDQLRITSVISLDSHSIAFWKEEVQLDDLYNLNTLFHFTSSDEINQIININYEDRRENKCNPIRYKDSIQTIVDNICSISSELNWPSYILPTIISSIDFIIKDEDEMPTYQSVLNLEPKDIADTEKELYCTNVGGYFQYIPESNSQIVIAPALLKKWANCLDENGHDAIFDAIFEKVLIHELCHALMCPFEQISIEGSVFIHAKSKPYSFKPNYSYCAIEESFANAMTLFLIKSLHGKESKVFKVANIFIKNNQPEIYAIGKWLYDNDIVEWKLWDYTKRIISAKNIDLPIATNNFVDYVRNNQKEKVKSVFGLTK